MVRRSQTLALALVLAVTLGSCGGAGSTSSHSSTSASSAERTRLLAQLRSQLEAPGSPVAGVHDLDQCALRQAATLPLATLRKLASSAADVADADPLLARCVAAGKGLTFVRGVIADTVAGKLPPPIPVDFTRCVVAGVNRLSPKQLASALSQAGSGNRAYSRQLGRNLALACVAKPSIFAHWRNAWLGGIRRTLVARRLPPAFVHCVLGKAARIAPSALIKLVQAGSTAEHAYGQQLGRECRPAIRT